MSVPGVPQDNKFEQVFGLGHQISLAEGGARMRAGGSLYGEVRYIMGMVTWTPPVKRQADTHTQLKTVPSRNFVGGR